MAKGTKTGGHTAGTPNKTTAELRKLISGLLQIEIDRLPEYFEQLAPEHRIQSLIKLLPFVWPKKQETLEDNFREPIQISMDITGGTNMNPKFQKAINEAAQLLASTPEAGYKSTSY